MNGDIRDNSESWDDWDDYDMTLDEEISVSMCRDSDKMTEADWERYGNDFERRYNEHLNSVKSSSPRRVGRSTASRYYDEEDGISSLLPTAEEIEHYRRSLGCDDEYNIRMVINGMCRPHEDTMAAFFLENCF